MTLAGFAAVTNHATLGLMVGANPFRNPALVVKEATTLDHMSNGRAILGIGGAWFEREHNAFGIDFGKSPGERLDWLDEAVELMRDMRDAGSATARGPRYAARDVRNDPRPIQARLPIVIGGSGERKTLRTVAKYADAWNTGGEVEEVRHKDEVLRRWCDEVGRDESEIERTMGGGSIVLRASAADAARVGEVIGARNGKWRGPGMCSTPQEVVDELAPYLKLGFAHVYFDIPAPYDDETLERLATEVKPALQQLAG
jgi:alkanesulfonate monooxygenase SsuD/methylene tetrahydromethanopterin reductase-like flavin-dependent oxidoreductase (luciferase family)